MRIAARLWEIAILIVFDVLRGFFPYQRRRDKKDKHNIIEDPFIFF